MQLSIPGNVCGRSAWVVDHLDQGGMPHIKSFATRKAAEAWSVTALHEVKQGTHTPSSPSVSVWEATERRIAHCEAKPLETQHDQTTMPAPQPAYRTVHGSGEAGIANNAPIYQFDADLRNAGRSIAMRRAVLTKLCSLSVGAKAW